MTWVLGTFRLKLKWQNGVITNTPWKMIQKKGDTFLLSFNREEDLFWFSFHKKLQRVAGENAESPEVTNSPYYCQSTPTCVSKDVRIQPASPLLMILRRSNMKCLKGVGKTGSWAAVCEGVWRFAHTWKCVALIRRALLSGRHILRLN